MRPCRVAFYCHQIRGLGHFALCNYLASNLAKTEKFETAIITSSDISLSIGSGIKAVLLPHISEPFYGRLATETIDRRIAAMIQFCRSWRPEFMIVDVLPIGVGGELLSVLECAVTERWPTVFAFNVPYTEGVIRYRPKNPRIASAYDVYSIVIGTQDPQFDPVLRNLDMFRNIRCKAYIGVAAPVPATHCPQGDSTVKRVLVLCGGGFYNTADFIRCVFDAGRSLLEEKKISILAVAGPLAGKIEVFEDYRHLAVEIRPEGRAEECTAEADVIISRCGYNTAYTVIQGVVPIIFIPTSGQEGEQINRAKKLANIDRVWSIEETGNQLNAALSVTLTAALAAGSKPRQLPFTTQGAARLSDFLIEYNDRRSFSALRGIQFDTSRNSTTV